MMLNSSTNVLHIFNLTLLTNDFWPDMIQLNHTNKHKYSVINLHIII